MSMSDHPPRAESSPAAHLVFLYDVDNTLLNNDALKHDLDVQLDALLGVPESDLFWRIYEDVRQEEDVVDIPEALRRFEAECTNRPLCLSIRNVFDRVDFPHYLYPGALDTLRYTASLGTNVILSDGDQVFQRRKIEESGIAEAALCHVLIYVHKEEHVDEIRARFPARNYVMIDDKPRILKALPPRFGGDLRTVFVCQGKYAHDPKRPADLAPDLTIAGIADLQEYSAEELRTGRFHRQGSCPVDGGAAQAL
jgi:FMN phosphatase YigB (HAD superfamily)